MGSDDKNKYEDTINSSREASFAKAMEIMIEDIEKNQVKQVITRPKVSLLKGLILLLIYGASFAAALVFVFNLPDEVLAHKNIAIMGIIALWVIVALLCMKRFLIWLILIYQKYAPEELRMQCFFKPSCSEYMKLSIQKYGVIRGVKKGCVRLGRCRWPNGGEDYP